MLAPDLKASELVHPDAERQTREEIESFDDLLSTDELAEIARSMYRFSAGQLYRMAEAGIFADGENVELINGWIIEKMPENAPHAGSIGVLLRILRRYLPPDWVDRGPHPINLGVDQPQPDASIVRGRDTDFLRIHPLPKQVGLVIEVSDSTLRTDRKAKVILYASASIPQYWILNIVERRLEVHSEPLGTSGYRAHVIYRIQDTVPFILDGQVIAQIPVAEFFPEPTA